MTVTLEIPTETAVYLKHRADYNGLTLAEYLQELVAADEADTEETVKIVNEALADLKAGERGMLLEDYIATVQARQAARKQTA